MKKLALLLTLMVTIAAHADDGAAILARVDEWRSPLDSFAIDVELTSFAPHDQPQTSKFRVYGKGADRSVVEFIAPSSEKGKLLLMLRDAMWIYLPSASRPIRISPLQRLMGQASNGDVARTAYAVDYVVASMSEVTSDGRRAALLDLRAKDAQIAYSRVQLWVDRETYEPLRADFYVVSGKLIKRAHFRELGRLAGRRAVTAIEIEDLLRPGNRTLMKYANLVPKEIPDRMFSRDALVKW